ncbi:hypothetical protein GN956_G18448 [Arapaima gigas]
MNELLLKRTLPGVTRTSVHLINRVAESFGCSITAFHNFEPVIRYRVFSDPEFGEAVSQEPLGPPAASSGCAVSHREKKRIRIKALFPGYLCIDWCREEWA